MTFDILLLQVEEPFKFFFCHKSDDFRHSDDLSDVVDRRTGHRGKIAEEYQKKSGCPDNSCNLFTFPEHALRYTGSFIQLC
jgi:hypothetical protein